jgi:hypothetical protein
MVRLVDRYRQARAAVERQIAALAAFSMQRRARRVDARLREEGLILSPEQLPSLLRDQAD